MRQTALRLVSLAAIALLAGFACGDSGPAPSSGKGGSGGTGGIHIIPGGGSGGDGGTGGTGGTGGQGGGEPPPPFDVTGVYPSRGTVEGGTRVTITGVGFLASVPGEVPGESTVVFFGDNPSVDSRVVDDRTIQATTPPGLEGVVDVVVRNSSGARVCAGCFTYLPPLDLRAIEPASGPLEGGTRVVLRGEGLEESTLVLFGNRAALLPEVQPDGSLSVVLPPGDEAGLVDVRAISSGRYSVLRRVFRYQAELRIDAVQPPASPLSGGETALLRGEGFTSSTKVFFGATEAAARLTPSGLEVTIPRASAPGPVEVSVRDGDRVASYPFAYFDPADGSFDAYAVAPGRGLTTGGAEVLVLGSGFDRDTLAVYFGSTPASDVQWESANVARVVAPPGSAGTVDVRVRSAGNQKVLPGAFRYVRSLSVQAVAPAVGPVEGGTSIAIQGEGFPENPLVYVGALPAKNVVRVDANRIEAVTPPGTDGVVPVRVVDAADADVRGVLGSAFRYEGPLRLDLVDPPTGARAGGTRVFLRGTGFRGDLRVRFGDAEAEHVSVVDPFTLEVLTPRGNVGTVDVSVEREDGATAVLEGGFSYFNPISGNGGASGGPLAGVLNVTALAASGPNENQPIPGCQVFVGADDSARLVKETDARGQVTFSDPSLVKAVSVSVLCEHYELATVANHASENLTVLLEYNGPVDPPPPPPQPEPGTVGGRVYGFKRPPSRELAANEEEVAIVSVAFRSVFNAPPFVSEDEIPVAEVLEEGGEYAFTFRGAGYFTFYAIYGIRNVDTRAFEPLLFGYTRGVSVGQGETYMGADIVLDTRLDRTIPVSILNPPWDAPNSVVVTAYLDLGGDGIIRLGTAVNRDVPGEAILTNMPAVSGESLLFQAMGHDMGRLPFSLTYRRQSGDPTQGVTIGPLLGLPTITWPPLVDAGGILAGYLDTTLEWEIASSAVEPNLISINIFQPVLGGSIPHWHVVLPGDERRVTVPTELVAALTERLEGAFVIVQFVTGAQPTFSFPNWNYLTVNLGSLSSFTIHQFALVPR